MIEFMVVIRIFRKQQDIELRQLMGNGIISFHSDYQVLYIITVFTGDGIGIKIYMLRKFLKPHKSHLYNRFIQCVPFLEGLTRNISFRSSKM